MIDFKDKFKELYDGVKDIPRVQLKIHPGEERGDDCASSIGYRFTASDISLFLLSKKTAEDGFVEKFCLDEIEAKRLKEIRKKVIDNPVWEKEILNTLEKNISIPYEKFEKLDLGEQLRLIDNSNLNQSIEEKGYSRIKKH